MSDLKPARLLWGDLERRDLAGWMTRWPYAMPAGDRLNVSKGWRTPLPDMTKTPSLVVRTSWLALAPGRLSKPVS